MDFTGWLDEVAHETRDLVAASSLPAGYATSLQSALQLNGKILADHPTTRWPLFVIGVHQSLGGGDWRRVVPAAAAVELFVVALDVLDEIEDGDNSSLVESIGQSQALNVTSGLLVLSQTALLSLVDRGFDATKVIEIARIFADRAMIVGGGQYLDLHYEHVDSVTEDQALEVVSKKSATLVSIACEIGARLATDDVSTIAKVGSLGWLAGMYGQITNDLNDAVHGSDIKTDFERSKKTVPLVAYRNLSTESAQSGSTGLPNVPVGDVRAALLDSGALHYAWVTADIYHRRALAAIEDLGSARATTVLRTLLFPGKTCQV